MEKLVLVGTPEIHELYGLTKMRVSRFIARGEFPAPVYDRPPARVWLKGDVSRFVAKLKREGRL